MNQELATIAIAHQLLDTCREIVANGSDIEVLREEKDNLVPVYSALRKLAAHNNEAARLLWEFPLVLGLWAMPVLPNELIRWNKLGERAARSLRDRTEAGEVLIGLNCNLAGLYAHWGRLAKAEASLRVACYIADNLGRTLWLGRLFGDLGEILMQKGDLTEADLWLKDSLAKAHTVGDAEGENLALFRLAQWMRVTGDYAGALPLLEAVLGRVRGEASTELGWKVFVDLSIVRREQGDLEAAESYLNSALEVARKDDLLAQERIYEGQSITSMRRRDLTRAYEYRARAVQINRKLPKGTNVSKLPTYGLEDRLTTANLQMGQAALAFAQGKTEDACDDFRNALDSFRKGGDPAGECEALYNIALAECRLGHLKEATPCAQEALDSARVLGHPLFKQAEALLQKIRRCT